MKVGDRVKITGKLQNCEYSSIPTEDIPVGTEGVITSINNSDIEELSQVWVDWDNGSTLALLPGDPYEVI